MDASGELQWITMNDLYFQALAHTLMTLEMSGGMWIWKRNTSSIQSKSPIETCIGTGYMGLKSGLGIRMEVYRTMVCVITRRSHLGLKKSDCLHVMHT